MSDERADAIPEAAVEAVARFIAEAWHKREATVDDWDREQARKVLTAAAPHMTGSGEAERIVAALRAYSDDVDRVRAIGGEVARISHRLADYIEREFAQPDAERAPEGEGYGRACPECGALGEWNACPHDVQGDRAEQAPQPEPRQDEVEAVARALWYNNRADKRPQAYPYERLIDSTQADLLRLAEAVIAALDTIRRR